MTIEEIKECQNKWRGPELYEWASYVEKGGKIYPVSMIKET